MEKLIPTINKLQDVFNATNTQAIDLPRLVVVGSQSAGKSSVIEHIVGRDFLPRGSDIVTRRPLVLQLIHDKDENAKERAEFSHKPDTSFWDFDEIRKEIEKDTIKVAGKNKGINSKPILLKIYSPKVLNLTLVDLPGVTKVPVGEQPPDIEMQIRSLVLEYIKPPNTIVLAVSPANVDLANSDSLQLARMVDPEGNRTVGIITKVDLMDQGTNALNIVTGKSYPLKLGYFPVVNRSQKDINENKKIAKALQDEETFFKNHPVYGPMASKCGTAYLADSLNKFLINHIRETLPALKRKIEDLISEAQARYERFGGIYGENISRAPTLLRLLTQYSSNFVNSIEGNSSQISTRELCGGASIFFIFDGDFNHSLKEVDPLKGLSDQEIRHAVRNANGIRPALFVHDKAFENLVREAIKKLKDPCNQCVEQVHTEVMRVMESSGSLELSRYPELQKEIFEAVTKMIKERLNPTKAMVNNLIEIEVAYINTSHPDFHPIFPGKKPQTPTQPKQKGSDVDAESSSSSKSSIWNVFSFGRGGNDHSNSASSVSINQEQPNVIRTPVSDQEAQEIEYIKQLIKNYFNVVRKSVQDTVPKAIVYFLIENLRENMNARLVQELYKEDRLDDLLRENPAVAEERLKCKELLDNLKKASLILAQISENEM